jgi:hypothetical protein
VVHAESPTGVRPEGVGVAQGGVMPEFLAAGRVVVRSVAKTAPGGILEGYGMCGWHGAEFF